jgi:uncharacterized membrane protein
MEHNHTNHFEGGGNPDVLMGILSYIGPLVIISYLAMGKNAFVKFHVKQGLVLFCLEIILWLLSGMLFWRLWVLMRLINLCLLVLSIIGIINAAGKKEVPLPVVGGLSKHFRF